MEAVRMQVDDVAAARIRELAAHIHAAQAELAGLAADFDDRGLWNGAGIRTCRHWLTINTGLGEHSADELLRVGHALSSLPLLRAAFESGQLSLDKLRLLSRVACAQDEEVWLGIARCASGAQLARICRGYLTSGDDGDATAADRRRGTRGLWASWRDDGLLELAAVLLPEDGAVVLAALDAAAERTGTPGVPSHQDPASCPRSARRADALVAVCAAVAGGDAAGGGPAHRVVVHVDLDVLTDANRRGRCQVEEGPGLARSVALRLGCDTELLAIAERAGLPVDVGRTRRTIPGRLRQAIRARDGGCRYPGCPIPARFTEGHHVRHWSQGGPTTAGNLLCLCGFHHRRHHDGAFDIGLTRDGVPAFRDPRGRPIGAPQGPPLRNPGRGGLRRLLAPSTVEALTADTPVALDRGARFDLGLTTEILHDECGRRRSTPREPRPERPM